MKSKIKTLGLGIASFVMYALVFTNTELVMKYFTRGGIFATLPIITVFAVSFIYGPFTSNIWSMLGIEASKPVQPQKSSKATIPLRPRVYKEVHRPRLSLELPTRKFK